MIMGIDGNEANVAEMVGVSVYTCRLLEYFRDHSGEDLQFRVFLRRPALPHLPEETGFFKYVVVHGPFLWSQLFLPVHLYFRRDISAFFSPAHYAPRFLKVPLCVTIHDLAYEYYPDEFLAGDLYKLRSWTKYSVEKALKVIAVSKTTKKDLGKFFGLSDDKVSVVYNGFDDKKNKADNDVAGEYIKKINLKNKNYVLYVGTMQPRKNVSCLLDAFAEFGREYPEMKLVLAGRKGWLFAATEDKINSHPFKERIIRTGYISDLELQSLYRHAFCLVMPSLYEGFGLPLLEAMSLDCPVISSFSSSLPEVGAEACLYFDPKKPDDLTDKLRLLAGDRKLADTLVKRGRQRIRDFSWSKSGDETLEVIKQAVPDKNGPSEI